jgi:phospholipid transport system substrate-binding protein
VPRRFLYSTPLLIVLALTLATSGWAGTATDQVRSRVDDVLKVLDDPAVKGAEHARERRVAVRRIMEAAIDVPAMAERALGRHWAERTDAERREFVILFTDLLDRAYLGKIDSYDGDQIAYIGEGVDGDRAVVQARVTSSPQGNETLVDFRLMRAAGDGWRVDDVAIGGASLVENYRGQFNTVIRRSSYGELVKKIRSIVADQK